MLLVLVTDTARLSIANGISIVIQKTRRGKCLVLLVTKDIQAMKRMLLVGIGERNGLLFVVRRTSSEKLLVFFTRDRSLDGDRKSRQGRHPKNRKTLEDHGSGLFTRNGTKEEGMHIRVRIDANHDHEMANREVRKQCPQ